VLATGEAISVREFVEKTFNLVGISITWSGKGIDEVGKDQSGIVRIQINPVYFRPTEVPFLLGDASKARSILGWQPKYKIDDLVREMVESEKNIIGGTN
jgi:GDPmannose 4,6-dehydratase